MADADHAVTNSPRKLVTLVTVIKTELQAGAAAGLEHYRRAGEALLEAKEQMEHGEWREWLKRNFDLSQETARRYMKLVTIPRRRGISTLTEAIGERSRDERRHPAWHEPIKQEVAGLKVDRWKVEAQKREEERRLLVALSHQLIDIGYKVLATKLHPDKGGSAEAMKRLNKVRKLLKEAI